MRDCIAEPGEVFCTNAGKGTCRDDAAPLAIAEVGAVPVVQFDRLLGQTVVTVAATVENTASVAATARKVVRLLRDLETNVSGQSDIIIDYATTRRREEPISTAITESTVQWLLHRRMNAQQMRWSGRGVHLMLKLRTAVLNATLDRDHAVAEQLARHPFGEQRNHPLVF